MPAKYDWITDEMFQNKLEEILGRYSGAQLYHEVPNIKSDIMEHFNNEVLEELEDEKGNDGS